MNTPKDNAKSVAFRTSGNVRFGKKTTEDYLKALKFYNKAICFAPNNSENLSIGYANRSAIYFQLFMFEECLENIEMVHKINNYPSHLWDKLKKRESECRRIIAAEDPTDDGVDEWKEPKLSFPSHKRVPYIADCLEMRQNVLFGNHIVTTRDLKVGEIVGVIKPFCTAQAQRYQYERCENCSKEKSQNLIPCPSCTVVMFCDENCMKEATDGFHRYECVAIDLINLIIPFQQDKLTLRTIMCGLSICQDIDKFLDITLKTFKNSVTIFDIDHNCKSDQYAVVAALKKVAVNDEVLVGSDVSNLLMICEKIFTASNIVSKKTPSEFKKILKHIVEQFMRTVEINGLLFDDLSYHIVHKRSTSYDDAAIENNMSGVYPFIQMLPHSCIPNSLCSSFTNGKIVSIVRPIKAGEQLFHSTAGTFFDIPKAVREKSMTFKCQCIACTNNYPLLMGLPNGPIKIPIHITSGIIKSYKCDRKRSLANYQWVVEYLQNNDEHMPCNELATLFKYYTNMMKVIYSEELCVEMRINPVTQAIDISHDLRKLLNAFSI